MPVRLTNHKVVGSSCYGGLVRPRDHFCLNTVSTTLGYYSFLRAQCEIKCYNPLERFHQIRGHTFFSMVPKPDNATRIAEAQKLAKTDTSKAEAIYKDVLGEGPGSGEAALRDYEVALMGLGEIYRDTKRPNELADLVKTSRSVLSSFAKAKTAKLG